MSEKISLNEIKKELEILKNYENVRDSENKEGLVELKKLFKKYCDAMHSAGLQNYMRFYLLFICSASKRYVMKFFDWSEEFVESAEKSIYEHLYNEFNKIAG